MIELWDYQQEIVHSVMEAYKKCANGKEIVVLPTGAGKTICFCEIIRLFALQGKAALILAHRDELLDQAAEKYRLIKPDAIIGKVGGGIHQYGGEVTVASVATISRPNHLKNLKNFHFGIVIVDEGHHMAAPGYQKVLAALPDAFVLAVTATPDRLDKKQLFGGKEPLYQARIVDMISSGYLCQMRAIAIRTETNLHDMHIEGGDYAIDELQRAIDTPKRNKRVVDAYREHASGRKAICFGVTVAHARGLAYAFYEQGISSAVVDGNTPLPERARIYGQLRNGEISVLCNVQVLTEGFDEPSVDCVIMARPTKSRGLFTQCIGRGTRQFPGKADCIVLDLTDNVFSHRLQPQKLQDVLELDMKNGESVEEALERKEKTEKEAAERRIRKLQEQRHEDVKVDLFSVAEWKLNAASGTYVLEIGPEKHRIALVPSHTRAGTYVVWARLAPAFRAQCWSREMGMMEAMNFAEKEARKLTKEHGAVLVDRDATWRDEPATPRQLETLDKFHVSYSWNITKGQAAALLDETFARVEQRKKSRRIELEDVTMG